MIYFNEASLSQLSIHKTGNKSAGEDLVLSEHSLVIQDEVLAGLLMRYFLSPFEKTTEIYRFYHPSGDLALNEIFHFSEKIFQVLKNFHPNAQQIARHLYDISSHPNIKAGELYIAGFKNLQVEGETKDAIGIFKSESKEPYLTVEQKGPEFQLGYTEQAINIKKLDKGCLIFNCEKEEGYKVAVIDQTNRSEAVYWIDEFLKLKVRNDNYTKTHSTLGLYKNFITKELPENFELSRADKIDMLNRSINYFKDKEHFQLEEFAQEVIGDPQGMKLFKEYKKNYEKEYDTKIDSSFLISDAAVKKQARHFKSVLKLDKNFHIYIHGNKDLIEKGFDEQKKMNYYKVFFKEEN